MTRISKDAKLVTFINVFTVEPANQQRLVELLARVTDTSVRHAPGFVSSALHRSLDGTKVTMYAQWRTVEDYEAMRKDPAPAPYLQEALKIAKFEPGLYEVVESFLPGNRAASAVMPMSAEAIRVHDALHANARLFLQRAIDALPADEGPRGDPPLRREEAVMAAVLMQVATELALKAGFVREDGLLSIVTGDDAGRTELDIVERIERNVSVATFKFDALKTRAEAARRFGLTEDDWAVAKTFQTMRNRLVHIDFSFHPDDLYDLKWDLLHMLVHVIVRLLHVPHEAPESFRVLLGDRFFKLLDWPPYEEHLRDWAQLPAALECPSCHGRWFDLRELRCLRCGLEFDPVSAGVRDCAHCPGRRSVLYDKLNPQQDGTYLGRCLACGWHGRMPPT